MSTTESSEAPSAAAVDPAAAACPAERTPSGADGGASTAPSPGPAAPTPETSPTSESATPETPPSEESAAPGQREIPAAVAAAEQSEEDQKPRATRVAEGALLGGVCTGLARHLGWPVMVIRIGFVALMIMQFIGVIAYGALWLLLPPESVDKAPGVEAASRTGMRDQRKQPTRRADIGVVAALIALGLGLLWIVQISGLGISQQLFWPVAFACAGAALVWRQADSARQKQWKAEAGGHVWLAPFLARAGWPAVLRVIVGLSLVGGAFGMVIAQQGNLEMLPQVMAMTVLALAGLAIVVAPWLHRSRSALNEARAEKVRADARADMAAHLHDSVLQTLALIQRQATDPKAVQAVARRQERELRNWLYGDELAKTTLKAALTLAASEVEDERGIPVDLVVVGDCDSSDSVGALLQAAREAMVNAAKHSGADKIDVYAEVDEDTVEVFVRDRGKGFDIDTVAEDRMGVRGSIIDRMKRHGGNARIRSTAEDGTEVRLEMHR